MFNFNPRSPRGERQCACHPPRPAADFNPRSPRGERRALSGKLVTRCTFQSTLPAWGATPAAPQEHALRRISIHAPRVGSDTYEVTEFERVTISIHAPRVGSDTILTNAAIRYTIFQSTLPAWGATILVGP